MRRLSLLGQLYEALQIFLKSKKFFAVLALVTVLCFAGCDDNPRDKTGLYGTWVPTAHSLTLSKTKPGLHPRLILKTSGEFEAKDIPPEYFTRCYIASTNGVSGSGKWDISDSGSLLALMFPLPDGGEDRNNDVLIVSKEHFKITLGAGKFELEKQ